MIILKIFPTTELLLLFANPLLTFIFGGEPKPYINLQNKVLSYYWEKLIRGEVEEAAPEHLIIIGKGVGRVLENMFSAAQVKSLTVLNQPQAKLSSQEQLELYVTCSKICNTFLWTNNGLTNNKNGE